MDQLADRSGPHTFRIHLKGSRTHSRPANDPPIIYTMQSYRHSLYIAIDGAFNRQELR